MASGSRSARARSLPMKFPHLEIKDGDVESDETLSDLYERWRSHYEVSRNSKERKERFVAFKKTVKYIHEENKMDKAYKLGLNQFSDWTLDEFESKYMGGCSPDQLINVYDVIKRMGGLLSEEDYRLRKIDGWTQKAMEETVMKHPVTAFMDSRGEAFKNYREGVLTVEAGKEQVHCACILSFDETPDGIKYWEIQNSWGQKWGDDGFMKIQRGVNLCGIASFVSHPNLDEKSVKNYPV